MRGIWKVMACVLVASMFVMPFARITKYMIDETGNSGIERTQTQVQQIRRDNHKKLVGRHQPEPSVEGDDTEYWAVLIAGGVYADNPDYDRDFMVPALNNLYSMLLQSDQWQEDHIKVLRGEECTAVNVIQALRWLARQDDENDISLVYITTLGFQGPDLPPFDEEDEKDEYLVTYHGIEYPFTNVWDDELNFLLSRLDSQGVAVILDCGYSGGVGDSVEKDVWVKGILSELQGDGRVILMSCAEEESSYGSYFTDYVREGLTGYADTNMNETCSAEEAFRYAEPMILGLASKLDVDWHPQLYDGYLEELGLTTPQVNEVIDQQQIHDDSWARDIYHYRWGAQSFVPTLSRLTKVRLHLLTVTDAHLNLQVSIRKQLMGEDLTNITKKMEGTEDRGWVEFDFEDITVTPGKTYYIVLKTGNISSHSYCFCWYYAWADKTISGPYKQGKSYLTTNEGESWDSTNDDFCFKTYAQG